MPGRDWVTARLAPGLNPGISHRSSSSSTSPAPTIAAARWDFPIRYDGNGADDMWVDRMFFEDSFDQGQGAAPGLRHTG